MKSCPLLSLTAAATLLASCAELANVGSVSHRQIGVKQDSLPATVIAAEEVAPKAGDTGDANAARRAVSGSIPNVTMANEVGLVSGLVGGLASRYLVESMGKTRSQRLTVRVDGSGETFSFVQPVYKTFGPLTPGTHGNYHHGANAYFTPDF